MQITLLWNAHTNSSVSNADEGFERHCPDSRESISAARDATAANSILSDLNVSSPGKVLLAGQNEARGLKCAVFVLPRSKWACGQTSCYYFSPFFGPGLCGQTEEEDDDSVTSFFPFPFFGRGEYTTVSR